MTRIAVSYTHLDVYKRQGLPRFVTEIIMINSQVLDILVLQQKCELSITLPPYPFSQFLPSPVTTSLNYQIDSKFIFKYLSSLLTK